MGFELTFCGPTYLLLTTRPRRRHPLRSWEVRTPHQSSVSSSSSAERSTTSLSRKLPQERGLVFVIFVFPSQLQGRCSTNFR